MASRIKPVQVPMTGAAIQLTALKGANAETVVLKNGSATNPMYIGNDNTVAAGTGFRLAGGESISMDMINPGNIWMIGTNADVLYALILSP